MLKICPVNDTLSTKHANATIAASFAKYPAVSLRAIQNVASKVPIDDAISKAICTGVGNRPQYWLNKKNTLAASASAPRNEAMRIPSESCLACRSRSISNDCAKPASNDS
jgi:hypothetical protein